MTFFYFILISFICLIIVGIWYDRIIPRISDDIASIRSSNFYKNWMKPILYGVLVFISCWLLLQDWGMVNVAPGGVSDDYGFPVGRSVLSLASLWAFIIIFRKVKAFYHDVYEGDEVKSIDED